EGERLLLCKRDDIFKSFDLQIAARHKHKRRFGSEVDRHQPFQRIAASPEQRSYHDGAVRSEQQRIPVTRRSSDVFGGNCASVPGTVLYVEALLEPMSELFGDDPCDRIRRAASSVRRDDTYWPCGICLLC